MLSHRCKFSPLISDISGFYVGEYKDDCPLQCLRRVVWWELTDVSDMLAVCIVVATWCTSETSVGFYQTARRNITEDSNLHSSA
jgi:hypothetical protein